MKRIIIGTVLVSLFFLASCGQGGEQRGAPESADATSGSTWEVDTQNQAPIAVEAVEVSKGKLFPYIESSGTVSGINEAFVVSETQGIIREVTFEIGDTVKKGQVLLKVDDNILRLTMEQVKQEYETAKIDLEATERFYNQGTASLTELTSARSRVNGLRARYESALKAYEDTSLKAPIDGVVAGKDDSMQIGNYLNVGFRVARIVDLTSLKLSVSVGERQIGLIEEGADAEISIPAVDENLPIVGRVEAVSAGSNPSTGSYEVIVTAPNPRPDLVKAGMYAKLTIETKESEPVLIIPSSSVVNRDQKSYVFTERDGSAYPAEIDVSRVFGNRAVVDSGLQNGEKVIISGLSVLKPGDPVGVTIIGKSGEWQ